MPTVTVEKSVNFGPAYSGRSDVGYTLTGGARTTAGVAEKRAGSGIYYVTLAVDPAFAGGITWDVAGGPPYAEDDLFLGMAGPAGAPASPPAVAALTTGLTAVYATDEDIFVEGGADFGVIVPRSNLVARGTDGVFSAGDPWTLRSASSAFTAQGVAARMVCKLSAPPSAFATPQYLAVDGVAVGALALRRCGLPNGTGQPPAPAAGLAGVAFEVLTLLPQIENTAYALNESYGVDPRIVNRRPDDVYDQRVFRRLTALRVLYLQYMNLNRSKAGDFADKQAYYREEYDAALDTAVLRWGPVGSSQPANTRFSTRISR